MIGLLKSRSIMISTVGNRAGVTLVCVRRHIYNNMPFMQQLFSVWFTLSDVPMSLYDFCCVDAQ